MKKNKVIKQVVDGLNVPIDLGWATVVIKKVTRYSEKNYFTILREKKDEN